MRTEMSVNEAIERLQDHMRVHKMSEPRAHFINTAFEMAIDALKNQGEVKMEKIIYYCDICGKEFEKHELITRGYPVYSKINSDDGAPIEPHVTWYQLSLCKQCCLKSTNLKCGFRGENLSFRNEGM